MMCVTGSRKWIFLVSWMVSCMLAFAWGSTSFAFDGDEDISKDPFVVLFQAKLDEAHAEVVSHEAAVQLAKVKFDTAARLLTQGATSREDYDTSQAALRAAEAQLEVMRQRVVARKALLDVVILNRLAGREIQQCL